MAATSTLQILAVALIGAIVGGSITYCLNIPLGKEKITAKATIHSAVINIALNFFAIPLLSQNGAAITTVISEFFVAAYCIAKFPDIRNYLDINIWKQSLKCAIIGCFTIVIITFFVNSIAPPLILKLFFIFVISVFIYWCELVVLKNPMALLILSKFRVKK